MTRLRVLFVVVLAVTMIAALMPSAHAPTFGFSDKINHMAAFVTLSAIAAWAWPAARLVVIGVAMSAIGAAIEGLQALPAVARDAEWADWYADTAAAVLTLTIVALVRRAQRD